MATPQQSLFGNAPFAFADRFLADHAGQIITEPRTAVLELIANAYDAGATKITIQWPTEKGEEFSVVDDGTGMTKAEFEERWKTLCYDRPQKQGTSVVFPQGVKGLQRTAFGRSGKGRFAPFCFSDSYMVVSWKDGSSFEVRVDLSAVGQTPFDLTLVKETKKSGHGTKVSAAVEKHLLPVEELRQLIGSKFLVDPSLSISVNGNTVQLLALEGLKTKVLDAPPHGSVTVHFIDSIEHYRTAQLRGITWWVNQRMVGEPSWERLADEGAYLDGRTEQAKRFSFIVEANFLKEDVKSDWSGFHANDPAAWSRLVTLYAPLVWHWCRKMALPRQEAADVFQDVFGAVAAHIHKFHKDEPGDTFRGRLRTITKNKVNDHYRVRRREPSGAGGTEAKVFFARIADPDHEIEVEDNEIYHQLFQRALELIQAEFEERTWRAFWRVVVDGQTSADVAREMAMTPGAVRVAKCRVLHRLRQELGDLTF